MLTLFDPVRPWAFNDLRPHAYNLIVADPPWLYQLRSEKGNHKSAQQKYKCYTPEEIRDLFPLDELAMPSCLLLLWATFPLIERQLACVRAWGFEYKSMVVWHKVFPSGRDAIGPGYRVRGMAEPIILATRGEPLHKPLPGLFRGIRREHSRKPDEFYDIVDRRCASLKHRADVFVRTRRPGWDPFGDQMDMFDHDNTRRHAVG